MAFFDRVTLFLLLNELSNDPEPEAAALSPSTLRPLYDAPLLLSKGSDKISSVSNLYLGFLQFLHVIQSPTMPWYMSVTIDLSLSSNYRLISLKYLSLSILDWSLSTILVSMGFPNLPAILISSSKLSRRQLRNSCTSCCSWYLKSLKCSPKLLKNLFN